SAGSSVSIGRCEVFLNRRDAMIRLGHVGLGAVTLPGLLAAERAAVGSSTPGFRRPRAKSCILLFLWGGPPQQDLWDMKPDAPNVGSIVSYFTPPGPMPACVTIPQPVGHNGIIYAGTYAGFLGPRHDPMEQPVSRALDPLKESNIAGTCTHPLTLPPDVDAT